MNTQYKRLELVFERILNLCKTDNNFQESISFDIDHILGYYLYEEDVFGTEGQLDPRGDYREGRWSVHHVQGVDE